MKHLLLIEDSSLDRKLAIDRLPGYEIDTAGTFDECEERLRTKTYDAVLLDLNIPGVRQDQILGKVKALAHGAAIIVLSAYVNVGEIQHFIRQNASQVLIKGVHDVPSDALPSAINTGIILNMICRKLSEAAELV